MWGKVTHSCFLLDGKRVALVCDDTDIVICELHSGQIESRYKASKFQINSICCIRDGSYILLSSDDRPIIIYDIKLQSGIYWIPDSPIPDPSVQCSYDSSRLLIQGHSIVVIMDMPTSNILRYIDDDDLLCADFSELCGQEMILGFKQGIIIQDVVTKISSQLELGNTKEIHSLVTGKFFATVDDRNTIFLWNNGSIREGNLRAYEASVQPRQRAWLVFQP